jgi:hypothetical protein
MPSLESGPFTVTPTDAGTTAAYRVMPGCVAPALLAASLVGSTTIFEMECLKKTFWLVPTAPVNRFQLPSRMSWLARTPDP